MRRRAVRACIIVAVLVAGALAIEAAVDALHAPPTLAQAAREDVAEGEAPPLFEEEVLVLAGREEVRVGADGAVVGFSAAGRSEEVFAHMAQELVDRGWEQVESGRPALGSFAKADGAYRWVLVSCTDAGGAVSVVVQCIPPEKGSSG